MNRQYRITLDGVALVDEPLGLIDTELNIVRDEKLKGIFFSYTTDLTFYGDGYTILRGYRDNGCASVPCIIEYDCDMSGAYQALFEGVIPIGSPDIEWNESDCTVTTKVENADFSNFLETYGEYEFRINTPFCLDGITPLASITEYNTSMFDNLDTGGSFTTKCYSYTDALRQCLAYLSNNAISLDEDPLYSTDYREQIIEVQFITPYASLGTYELSWVNFYGQQMQLTKAIAGASDTVFFNRLTHDVGFRASAADAFQARTNYLQVASGTGTPSANVWRIINYAPWKSFNQVTDGTVTISEIQAFQYGLSGLKITTDSAISQQDNNISTTLNTLMRHAVEMHNMGYYLRPTSPSTYDLVLRFYPDLIDNTNTDVHLEKVSGIMSKSSGDFSAVVLTTPKGIADDIFKPFSWSSGNCYGSSITINQGNISSEDIFSARLTDSQDDDLIYFFTAIGNDNSARVFPISSIWNDGVAFYIKINSRHYNAPYFMPLIAWRNSMYAGGVDFKSVLEFNPPTSGVTCANCPDAVIENDSGVLFKNVYSFEHQLSFSQVQAIISQSLQFITFSDTQGLNKTGFIKEITIPFKTFIANFELYTS